MFPKNFIAATTRLRDFDKIVSAPLMRRVFFLDSPATATITISGIGFYELYVNGEKVSGLLTPYISVPDHIIYYNRYDVQLRPGENVLGIVLGNGMQNVFCYKQNQIANARWYGAPMTALRLDVKCDNGLEFYIESDAAFKTAPSPIFFDDLRCGEHYDATKEISGWNKPGFGDSSWESVISVLPPLGEPKLCTADPIVVTHEISPKKITKCSDGYIYDFGANLAGVCRLNINGNRGQKIILTHGELLENGELKNTAGLLPADYFQKDVYICGGGHECYTPRFTYHGFQYVYVKGISAEQATPRLLTYLVMNSDLRERGGFTCSDITANTLQTLTRRSTLANFFYFPTDCPQREKDGWTGDAALSAEHTLLNLSPENSYIEWLHNIRKAQNEFGQIPNVVPTGGWSTQWGSNPAWDSVLIYLPYYTYVYRNNTKILEENGTAIFKYLHFLSTLMRRGGGLIEETTLGDWCPPGRAMNDYKSPSMFTNSAISLDMCQKAGFIFNVLGWEQEEAFALGLATTLRKNIRERLYDFETNTALGNCQTSQAMILHYDILAPHEKPAAFEKLLHLIEETNNHMDTGILGGRVIFHVLSAFGKSDLAFKMITQPSFPSYGNWVARGATSLWEDFQPDGGPIASRNHHFWGDISAWFIKNIAGINYNPTGRNHKEVKIAPSYISDLSYAEGFHITPYGKIYVKWERVAGEVALTVDVPDGFSLCYNTPKR